jgi:hypothetical protein
MSETRVFEQSGRTPAPALGYYQTEGLAKALQKALEEHHGCGPIPPSNESATLTGCVSTEHPPAWYTEEGCTFFADVTESLIEALPSRQGKPTT